MDKVSSDLDGSYDSTGSGSSVTLTVGALTIEDGGEFDFTIEPGSVLTGPNDTRVNLNGTISGRLKR